MLTALIDADMLVYAAAFAAERPIDWGDGIYTLHSFIEEAKDKFATDVEAILDRVGADEFILALSDPEHNWRKDVYPAYKANRADTRKPLTWAGLRAWITEEYPVWLRPGLEADDVLGILLTSPHIVKGGKVCVSDDKDLRSVPGEHVKLKGSMRDIVTVTEEEADLWHLTQTLTGDVVDGYPGCPGVGPAIAAEVLASPRTLEQRETKTGKTQWRKGEPTSRWNAIVHQFRRAGLTEEDALVQARVARICRREDYDFKNKEVILWTP